MNACVCVRLLLISGAATKRRESRIEQLSRSCVYENVFKIFITLNNLGCSAAQCACVVRYRAEPKQRTQYTHFVRFPTTDLHGKCTRTHTRCHRRAHTRAQVKFLLSGISNKNCVVSWLVAALNNSLSHLWKLVKWEPAQHSVKCA